MDREACDREAGVIAGMQAACKKPRTEEQVPVNASECDTQHRDASDAQNAAHAARAADGDAPADGANDRPAAGVPPQHPPAADVQPTTPAAGAGGSAEPDPTSVAPAAATPAPAAAAGSEAAPSSMPAAAARAPASAVSEQAAGASANDAPTPPASEEQPLLQLEVPPISEDDLRAVAAAGNRIAAYRQRGLYVTDMTAAEWCEVRFWSCVRPSACLAPAS